MHDLPILDIALWDVAVTVRLLLVVDGSVG
jgi:hypothetical protein